jgi:uncharacterized Zn ribbon protein
MKIKKVCELNEGTKVKDIIFVDNLVDSDTLTEEFIVSILDELNMMYKSEFMRKLDNTRLAKI